MSPEERVSYRDELEAAIHGRTSIRNPDFRRRIIDALLSVPNPELDRLSQENNQLRQHILDIDAHATPYGDIPDDPGHVGTYLVTAGALHRALGKIGHTAPKCEAEAAVKRVKQLADDMQDSASRMLDREPVENGISAGEIYEASVEHYTAQRVLDALVKINPPPGDTP